MKKIISIKIIRAPSYWRRMGERALGKGARRYFFVTDHVDKGNVSIEYCPTDEMIADFMTKPLQGQKFRDFRSDILGEQD